MTYPYPIYKLENDPKPPCLTAFVLLPDGREPLQLTGFLNEREAVDYCKEEYPGAIRTTPYFFKLEEEERKVHSPEMLALLAQHDVEECFVYGSYNRPVDAMDFSHRWVELYLPVDRDETGYYTYIVTSIELDPQTLQRYELRFVSHPQQPEVEQ